MISPKLIFNQLKKNNISLFAGVPDSLLSNFCSYLDDYAEPGRHIITANEGNAIALAVGYYLSTGKIGAVYMQNSGIGNAVNPLVSIADADVYQIPLLMLIGWRGEPGVSDEPQHVKQGRITPAQLDLLEIPYFILDANVDAVKIVNEACSKIKKNNGPVAILIRKNTFSKYKNKKLPIVNSSFQREDAIKTILELTTDEDVLISTTGKTSRELFELRVARGEVQRDFLTVGGMGHTASIALGVALGNVNKRVVCLDGDGSLLMHMGMMPIIGSLKIHNLIHVLLNNSSHESVGGQPTVAGQIDFMSLSKACGYSDYQVASDSKSLSMCWAKLNGGTGAVMLEIKIANGSRDDLGRPTDTPVQNKYSFMKVASV